MNLLYTDTRRILLHLDLKPTYNGYEYYLHETSSHFFILKFSHKKKGQNNNRREENKFKQVLGMIRVRTKPKEARSSYLQMSDWPMYLINHKNIKIRKKRKNFTWTWNFYGLVLNVIWIVYVNSTGINTNNHCLQIENQLVYSQLNSFIKYQCITQKNTE
jgi:hypothetical protein